MRYPSWRITFFYSADLFVHRHFRIKRRQQKRTDIGIRELIFKSLVSMNLLKLPLYLTWDKSLENKTSKTAISEYLKSCVDQEL